MFERWRDAFQAALDAAGPGDVREAAGRMREAVIEAKVGVREIRDAVSRTDAELVAERQRLADTERRGRLAGEIQDKETADVAERFAAKHRERVAVLERKAAAQRDELALAERELSEMQSQLDQAAKARPVLEVDPAHRELEAERQLQELKKRMRKD